MSYEDFSNLDSFDVIRSINEFRLSHCWWRHGNGLTFFYTRPLSFRPLLPSSVRELELTNWKMHQLDDYRGAHRTESTWQFLLFSKTQGRMNSRSRPHAWDYTANILFRL